jgi:hypothetical protein
MTFAPRGSRSPVPCDDLGCSEASDWLRGHGFEPIGFDCYSDGLRTVCLLSKPEGWCVLIEYEMPPGEPANGPAY